MKCRYEENGENSEEFLDLGFFRRWPARTEHLLGQVESNSRFALVFGDGEVVEHVKVAL